MFVRDWMSSPPIRGAPEMTRAEARELMERSGVRRLPVFARGRLVGIVTLSDLISSRPGDRVEDVMTRDPVTVPPDETLERAALLMLSRRISGLPVVEGEVIGMITETDIFRALVEVLGMHEKGARIVFPLKDPNRLVEEVRGHAGAMQVRSVVTYHDPHSGERRALLRLRGRPARESVS